MSFPDPIADMLTRIRNGQQARLKIVLCPDSSLRRRVLDVLQKEGYIVGYSREDVRAGVSQLLINLKYHHSEPVIRKVRCISTPGRRVYASIKKLPKFYNGLGCVILSTPQGVMSDFDARKANVGGEVICTVF
jgi:small subunit ribosomal protein S8